MKNLIIVLLLCIGVTTASAQEVYNSSGKKTYKKKKKTGYDPDKLIVGGWLNLGLGSGYVNVGVAPIVGYRFTKFLSAGIGVGYQYTRFPIFITPTDPNQPTYINNHMLYPSVWSRCFVYRNVFLSTAYEYDFIFQRPGLNNFGVLVDKTFHVTNSCWLVGVGLKQSLGGRVSYYGELFYDVLQGENSPYPHGSPSIRFGIAAGL